MADRVESAINDNVTRDATRACLDDVFSGNHNDIAACIQEKLKPSQAADSTLPTANQQGNIIEFTKPGALAPEQHSPQRPEIHLNQDTNYPEPWGFIENRQNIEKSVEKYGKDLDYSGKHTLDTMISSAATGNLSELKTSLASASPAAREAFANMMREELGLRVDLVKGSGKNQDDFRLLIGKPGDPFSLRMSFEKGGNNGWGSWNVSYGTPNSHGSLQLDANGHPSGGPDENWMSGATNADAASSLFSAWHKTKFAIPVGYR